MLHKRRRTIYKFRYSLGLCAYKKERIKLFNLRENCVCDTLEHSKNNNKKEFVNIHVFFSTKEKVSYFEIESVARGVTRTRYV